MNVILPVSGGIGTKKPTNSIVIIVRSVAINNLAMVKCNVCPTSVDPLADAMVLVLI